MKATRKRHRNPFLTALCAATVALAINIAPAQAGGTTSLEEVMLQLGEKSSSLSGAVEKAINARNLRIDKIVCDGLRLGRVYGELGGTRVPPYTCKFPGKTLKIDAATTLLDAGGKPTDDPQRAARIAISDVKWRWQ